MWEDIKTIQSSDKNVKKLVFTKESTNGAVAEAVLYKYPTFKDRTVICCSTQSGCPVGCRFCGTGEFFIRNLTTDEIVAQVSECMAQILVDENTKPTDIEKFQIMFMSMGEPMLNWRELSPALDILHESYPNANLLISTVGPKATSKSWTQLLDKSVEIHRIGLQFSIHEAFEEDRNSLIPMKNKFDLEMISNYGTLWSKHTGRRPYFNYCVHEKNNTSEHVQHLTARFDPNIWECTLSVICESDEGVAAANIRQRKLVEDFMQLTLQEGYSTRMFDPAGQDDIGGGCGQLWFVQEWADKHPELVTNSHGAGLEKVHTPR